MRIDASMVCFIFVMALAVPVATLRSKTFSIGYELGQLKNKERELRLENTELKSTLASVQRDVRDQHLQTPVRSKKEGEVLTLPDASSVIQGRVVFGSNADGQEKNPRK